MCWTKNTWKYVVDVGLLISGLIVIITGVIKFRSLWNLLGVNINYELMNMVAYRVIHDWSGLVMTIFVIIHLFLNWDWIKGTTRGFFIKK
jgi:hypothetical protein